MIVGLLIKCLLCTDPAKTKKYTIMRPYICELTISLTLLAYASLLCLYDTQNTHTHTHTSILMYLCVHI